MREQKKRCVAMLLAGGQGTRLGILTAQHAKPAIPFGGKHRVIDFPLSNCMHSGIDTVGVLTQFRPLTLNAYIGNGQPWDLDRLNGGVTLLPPYLGGGEDDWYRGTADAICRNIAFLDQYDPTYVLILSGDHVYRMDYSEMLAFHCARNADCTVAFVSVPIGEAGRYGILTAEEDGRVISFVEKPKNPSSNLASMGIYLFRYDVLRRLLLQDAAREGSSHDFGKDILPGMVEAEGRLYAWRFAGYFRDIGTPEAYFDANMDLVSDEPPFDLRDRQFRICSRTVSAPPHRIGAHAQVRSAIVTEGCVVDGYLERAVLSANVRIEKGAIVRNAVIMDGTRIMEGARVENCIIDREVTIEKGCVIGGERTCREGLTVIGQGVRVKAGACIRSGSTVSVPTEAEGREKE